MATNVSYASNDAALEALVLHILPDFGKHGDGIINSNLLTAMLKEKGAYQVVEGGLEFWYGISKQESSNAKWQGKNADMTADSQDPSARLRYDVKVFTSSVVLNSLDRARNRGKAAIKEWLMTLREQAISTNENQFNSAWWAATPGTDEPESIPSLISATPTTGTIGGLDRAGNAYLQNGADTDGIADIGSEAGIAAINRLKIQNSVGKAQSDCIIMGSANYAGLSGFLYTQRRFRNDEKMAQLGFDTISLGNSVVGYENDGNVLGGANSIPSGYMYGINTKFMKLKHLSDPGTGANGWTSQFERVGKSLNKAVYYNWFGNLTTNCPRAHWVATGVATT